MLSSNFIKTKLIYDYLKKNNMSKTKFCRRSGLAYPTLKRVLEKDNNITLFTASKISTQLNVDLRKLLNIKFKHKDKKKPKQKTNKKHKKDIR